MYHQTEHSEILCSAHNTFMCFAWISEQTAIISPYAINLSVFITEAQSVYCSVRSGSLKQMDTISSLMDLRLRVSGAKIRFPYYSITWLLINHNFTE